MFRLQSKITPFLWYDHQAEDAAALERAYDGA
jgi:predicted 3-demethylubiquinone-9 3-methyltransferase (glyoxalase superfamily)